MTDRPAASRLTRATIAALVVMVVTMPSPVRATVDDESVPSAPATSEPGTSEPGPIEPPTSEPATTTPPTPARDEDNSVNTAAAVIGAIGLAALIGLAGWWMVRRRDDDDAPHPRPPVLDEPPPGQDLL